MIKLYIKNLSKLISNYLIKSTELLRIFTESNDARLDLKFVKENNQHLHAFSTYNVLFK